MYLPTPLIFFILFVIACLSLVLVYKYGIKEKSYEEALAEQRQQANVLLGTKPKPKEKKSKKATKKSKEKPSLQDNETDESENVENGNVVDNPNKLHVEFKEPEEAPIEKVVQVKQKRVKKLRSILLRKDKSPEKVILDVIETSTTNHFEENPPKDEFALLRSNSKDNILKQELVKEKIAQEKKQSSETIPHLKTKKSRKQSPANNIVAEVLPAVLETNKKKEKEVEENVIEPVTNGIVGNPGKEKKKKKSEYNTRQQLTAERDELLNSVRRAELTKTEVQHLIDLLLDKQFEAPAVIDDWREGKSDPVQKLKKQLAEKEKAIAMEQEALLGVQAKLKEVRAEQLAERSQLQQKIKGLEEVLQAKLIELEATTNRCNVNTQKMNELERDLHSEYFTVQKLVSQNTALEMDMEVKRETAEKCEEVEKVHANLKKDFDKLSCKYKDLETELETCRFHKEQLSIEKNILEKELRQEIQQAEESKQKMERDLEIALRQESDWKIEVSNLNTALQQQFDEKRRLQLTIAQLREELSTANKEKVESSKAIVQLSSQLQQLKQVYEVNGSSEETKAHEIEILNLTNELTSIRSELSTFKTEAQQIENKYKIELESSNKKYDKLQRELEEQKAKNNELRIKNWKVMEALNAAENKCKTGSTNKQPDVNLDKLSTEIRMKEQNSQKQFMQRLFPEIKELQAVASEDWQDEFGRIMRNYVNHLLEQQRTPSSPEQSEDVTKLQLLLEHYKNIIDDTEGTLNKLQCHIEKEEMNWHNQLAAKEVELQTLKEHRLSPLQAKVTNLEQQLSQEISEKQRILQEYQLMRTQRPQPNVNSDVPATVTMTQLLEEVNSLREQLRVEETKNEDTNVKEQSSCSKTNSTNGPVFIEHCLSSSSSLASSVIEEYNKKPKIKKKKKKDSNN